MKNKFSLFIFIAIICGNTLLSCASSTKTDVIEPNLLIGTKWVSTIPFMGFSNTIEFIDNENCIYTLISGPKELTYKIKGNSIIIGRDQYILEGNTIYYKGNPHWVKQD